MYCYAAGRHAGIPSCCALLFGALLALASGSAPAKAEGQVRPMYQARCDFPHAAWNEEILRVRDAAERECKSNLVLHASDPGATLHTQAADEFWKLRRQHEALVRNAAHN